MKYTIEHNKSKNISIVCASGKIKRPNDSITLQQVTRHIRTQTEQTKILYNMRDCTILGNTLDIFVTATTPAKQKFERDFRIALVYTNNTSDHRFMENVLVNHGYTLRLFTDIEKAITWLNTL